MPSHDKRLNFLSAAIFGGFAIAALSQAKLQIVDKNSVLHRAEKNDRYIVHADDPAKRGTIFSADGRALAEDEDTHVLNLDFDKVPHTPAFFMDVSAATGIPASEFQQLADSGVHTRTWREPLSSAQSAQLEQVKSNWRADGISLAPSGRRTYPLAEAAAGFVGVLRDGKPQGGLESGFNKELSGQGGKKVGLVDRDGHFLPMRLDSKTVQRVDGQDLTLTIDSQIQADANDAIRQAVVDNKAIQGVAIVINPRNGDLVAMANWPSYDPNTLGDAVSAEQAYGFNPNYMAALEPGSMFKILTLAEAFDTGEVKDNDGVYCKGQLAVGRRFVRCDDHHGNRAHGALSPAMAIAKSCNVSAATWALRIGYDRYVRYMERLGIMSKPRLGIPRESPGLFNYNDANKELHLANLGFGQAVNATPVQLAGAFAMLANSGLRVQPRIVKKIGDKDVPVVNLGQIVKPEVAQKVMKIMQLVIQSDEGTGKSLRIPGYILGGKTGTAQKVNNITHTMTGGGYVANFVGFVPGDKPQYVILVMVDKPSNGLYYGATVAGPVFKELALDVINRFNIPPNAPLHQAPAIGVDLQTPIADYIYPPAYNVKEERAEEKERQEAAEQASTTLQSPQALMLQSGSVNENPLSSQKQDGPPLSGPAMALAPSPLNLNPLAPADTVGTARPQSKRRRHRRRVAVEAQAQP